VRKREELTNPNSCLNRARDDEWVFSLLGRDPATPGTIRFWIRERIKLGKSKPGDPELVEAELQAQAILDEQGGGGPVKPVRIFTGPDGFRYVECPLCGKTVAVTSYPDDARLRYGQHMDHGGPSEEPCDMTYELIPGSAKEGP
jgi:hypothetical protein